LSSVLGAELEGVEAEFRYTDAKSFREMVEALAKVLDEAKFEIRPEGIRVVGMDPSKTAYIEIRIPREAFLEYDINEASEDLYMGVNLEVLSNVVKKGKKGEPILFRVTPDKIFIEIESAITKRFLIPNIEIYLDVPDKVEFEHDVEATVLSDALKKAIRDVETIGNIVEFEAQEGRLIIRAKGTGRARAETIFSEGSSALLYIDVKQPSVSVYDVAYIKNVLNLTRIAEAVDVKFSSDRPLELVFRSPDESRVRYILAPYTV